MWKTDRQEGIRREYEKPVRSLVITQVRGDGVWTTAADVEVRRRGRILGKFAKYSHWDFLMAYTRDGGRVVAEKEGISDLMKNRVSDLTGKEQLPSSAWEKPRRTDADCRRAASASDTFHFR